MDKVPEKAKFFILPKAQDDAKLRAAITQRLFGEAAKEPVILSVDGVNVDDARQLRENDQVVVRVQAARCTVIKQPNPPSQSNMTATKSSGPRLVTVSFSINAIKAIDAIAHTVALDFQLYLSWVDPDLIGVPVEERPPYTDIWNPEVEVNNDVDLETLWSVFHPRIQDADKGIVGWAARYRGCISNPMDLRMFPFDADNFAIIVGPKSLTLKDCLLVMDNAKHGFPGASGDNIKDSSLEEYYLGAPFFRDRKSVV